MENSKHALFKLDDDPDSAAAPTVAAVKPDSSKLNLFTIATIQKQNNVATDDKSAAAAAAASDSKIDVASIPILLVKQEPKSSPVIDKLDSFKESGLVEGELTAINGPAMTIIINSVGSSGSFLDKLYLLPASPKFTSVKQIPAEQICFITLFHHLHFLATLHSASGTPIFADSFKDKYEFLKNNLDESDLKMFGIDVKDEKNALVTYWDSLQSSNKPKNTNSVYDMIKMIKAGPKEVYKYLTVVTEGDAAPAGGPKPAVPLPSAPPAAAAAAKPAVPLPSAPPTAAAAAKPAVPLPSAPPTDAAAAKPPVPPPSAPPTDAAAAKPPVSLPADVKPDPIPNSETVIDETASTAPTFSPSETTEAGLAGYPKPNGTVASKPSSLATTRIAAELKVGSHVLYGKDKHPAEVTKIYEDKKPPTYDIKKLKGTPDAGHDIFDVARQDIEPMLNVIVESNSEGNNSNSNSNNASSNTSTVAVSAADYQPQRAGIKGENKAGKELAQGAQVYFKDDKSKTYTVFRILGTKDILRKDRTFLIRDAAGKEVAAKSSDLEQTDEGLRRSTRSSKEKSEGGFRRTRKKNRKL